MSNTISDFQLLCACGVSYNINTSTTSGSDLPQDVYYTNAQFQGPPQIIQGQVFPETAACIIGQSTPSGQTNSSVIIAFRGTEYDSISDWATDLMVEPLTPSGFPSGSLVHSGFYYSTIELISQIQTATTALALPAGTPIYITGHSKGGAMAYLAAYMLCSASNPNAISASDVIITTFASPICGNNSFQASFNELFPAATNYVNYLDIVPFLPPTATFSNYIIGHDSNNTLLNSILADFTTWDFFPCYTNVNYIGKPPITPKFDSVSRDNFFFLDELGQNGDGYDDVQAIYAVIQTAITSKSLSGLAQIFNAHSHACGGGYWNALCPPEISCS